VGRPGLVEGTGLARRQGDLAEHPALKDIQEGAFSASGRTGALHDAAGLVANAAPQVSAQDERHCGRQGPVAGDDLVGELLAGDDLVGGPGGAGDRRRHPGIASNGVAGDLHAGDLVGDLLAGDNLVAELLADRPAGAIAGVVVPQPAQITGRQVAQLSRGGSVAGAGTHKGYSVTVMV
jgi:hypothetical protein